MDYYIGILIAGITMACICTLVLCAFIFDSEKKAAVLSFVLLGAMVSTVVFLYFGNSLGLKLAPLSWAIGGCFVFWLWREARPESNSYGLADEAGWEQWEEIPISRTVLYLVSSDGRGV